jgi:hypothetical protein
VVRASGNEVFALGDKTGTRHCLVAVTGTGGEERGAPSNDGDASNLAGPDPSSKRQCRTGAARVPPVGGFCPPDRRPSPRRRRQRRQRSPRLFPVFLFVGEGFGDPLLVLAGPGSPVLFSCAGEVGRTATTHERPRAHDQRRGNQPQRRLPRPPPFQQALPSREQPLHLPVRLPRAQAPSAFAFRLRSVRSRCTRSVKTSRVTPRCAAISADRQPSTIRHSNSLRSSSARSRRRARSRSFPMAFIEEI